MKTFILPGASTDSWEALSVSPGGNSGLGHAGQAAITYHVDYFRVDGLCDHIAIVGDVFYHLAESSSLYFLPLEVT